MKCKLAKWKVRVSWMANLYGCTDMQIRWKAAFVTRVGINFSIVIFPFAVFQGTLWLSSLCTLRIEMFQGLDSRKLVFDTSLRIKCYFFSCEKSCLWFHQEEWFMCPALFSFFYFFFPSVGEKSHAEVGSSGWLVTGNSWVAEVGRDMQGLLSWILGISKNRDSSLGSLFQCSITLTTLTTTKKSFFWWLTVILYASTSVHRILCWYQMLLRRAWQTRAPPS